MEATNKWIFALMVDSEKILMMDAAKTSLSYMFLLSHFTFLINSPSVVNEKEPLEVGGQSVIQTPEET